ncbi:hypothetical protein HBZS_115020 [Helicobacter bizzozeronii CCUG 35545]|nr:hypothetical protein HBZS_115020 [Helicobacter bizzozeronii CCUG 35545]
MLISADFKVKKSKALLNVKKPARACACARELGSAPNDLIFG